MALVSGGAPVDRGMPQLAGDMRGDAGLTQVGNEPATCDPD